MTKRLSQEEKSRRVAATKARYAEIAKNNAGPLSLDKIKEHVHYDSETGLFTWKKITTSRVKVGDVIGSKMANGYLDTSLFGRRFFLHRLAWYVMTGEMPVLDIDHINRVRDDNRWANLRHVTRSVNLMNRELKVLKNGSR